ncbi:nitroreductase family protein [Sphingomonas sp. T9W2]|uniref:nitroreductase family protein n=1 Tax=Sphingomonas sp. T9W2 TaxID=3143183 RepID=UPI0031F4EEC5
MLKQLYSRLSWKAQRYAIKKSVDNNLIASIYYGFFNHQHMREIKAVAAGQVRYAQDHAGDAPSYYMLRRNIHRLEKGLIMRPRRRVFAADFINDTVGVYARAAAQPDSDQAPEVVWAHDVLDAYFAAVDREEPRIARAYAKFEEVERSAHQARNYRSAPYQRDLDGPPPVDFKAMQELAERRRSVRWYLDKPVDRGLIDQALAVAGQSPSACNRQPFHFRIFDQKDLVKKVAAIPMGTKGFSDNLPAVAVVVGQLRAYPLERDKHVIYIDGSLAAMSFMYALESLGLSSCPINWPDQEPQESQMRAALNLEADERVVMLIGFGWPDPEGQVARSTKRPVPELRRFN